MFITEGLNGFNALRNLAHTEGHKLATTAKAIVDLIKTRLRDANPTADTFKSYQTLFSIAVGTKELDQLIKFEDVNWARRQLAI